MGEKVAAEAEDGAKRGRKVNSIDVYRRARLRNRRQRSNSVVSCYTSATERKGARKGR